MFYMGFLTLDGNKANQTVIADILGIRKVGADALVESVYFKNSKGNGVGGSGFGYVSLTFRNCTWDSNALWGVQMDNMLHVIVEGGIATGNTGGGVKFTKSSGTVIAEVIGTFFQSNGIGVQITGDFANINGVHVTGTTSGPSIHGFNSTVFQVIGSVVDGGTGNAIDNGVATYVNILGNTVRNITPGTEQRGIVVAGATGGQVVSNICTGNGHQGILIADSANIVVSGNTVANNGKAVVQQHGIRVWANAANVADITVVGNRAFDNSTATQLLGIGLRYEVGRTMTNVRVAENELVGNATAGFSNEGGGGTLTGLSTWGNTGYVTQNSGITGAIATLATVAHGLSVTPTIVLLTAQDGVPTAVFPSAIGATTFTINYTGGGTHAFAWSAQ
jgi:parallel beta-helix repeat protein